MTSDDRLPYMPFFVDDYEAATAHLSTEEDGAYNRLMRLCWRQSSCSIPDDPKWICRHARVDAETFERAYEPVIDEFFTREKGRIWQKRQRAERERIEKVSRARKEAGSKGGKAKALKRKGAASSKATDLPLANDQQTDGKDLASISIPRGRSTEVDKSTSVSRAEVRSAFADFWDAYPRRVGKKAAEAKFEQAVKSGVPPSRIIAAARAYAEHPDAARDGGRYLKHPTTWLNQGCWDDELPAPQPRQLHCISGGQDGRAQYTPGEQRMLRDREVRIRAAHEAARMLAAEQAEEG